MRRLKFRGLSLTALLWLSGTLHAQMHLELAAKQVENFGVHTVLLQSTQAPLGASSEARVLDASVLHSQISDLETSINSLAFSSAQQASITRLFQNQQNASRAALAQATLLMRTDQNNLARAQTALRTTWGDPVASWSATERARRVAQLRAGSASLLRLELNAALSANTRFSTADASLEWLGLLPNADAQTGRAGALLWLKPGAPALSRLQVQLSNSTPTNDVAKASWLIPRSAVLRINGGYFVFVETATPEISATKTSAPERALHSFEMRELVAPLRSPDGWLVQQGFSAGEQIVDAGAASLLTMARGAGAEE